MNHRRHQAEHAARPLKTFQCRPVLVEAVEHLGVNRIARDHTLTVLQLAGLHGKYVLIRMVHLAECRTDAVSGIRVLAVEEEAAAHNLKALVRRHGFPDRLHTPKGMCDTLKRSLPCRTANLDLRLRDRRDHETVLTRTCRLGDLLDKGNEVVKRAGRKTVHTIDFLCIGDQLIHEDEARPRRVKEIFQCLRSGRSPLLVRLLHIVVELRIARRCSELCRHLPPQRMNHQPRHVRRTLHPRRVYGRTDEHCHVRLGQCGQPRTREDRPHCRDLVERYRSVQHVIERKHTVRLAAAECRLELDHGLAVLAADASKRLHEQPRHALGHIGTRKELHGVAILERALATCDLCEVCSELGVLVPSRRHIQMRFDYVAPARQTAHGGRLLTGADCRMPLVLGVAVLGAETAAVPFIEPAAEP